MNGGFDLDYSNGICLDDCDFIKRLIRFCINKSIISCLSLVYYPLKYFYLIINLLLIMLSYIKAIPIISNIVKILKKYIPRVNPFVD